MHKINIYNNQKAVNLRVNRARLKDILKYILKRERRLPGIYNFVFVDNKDIRRINRQYLGRSNVTDVIAFPLSDRPGMPTDNIKGEIFVSVEEAMRQSRKRDISCNEEITLYCIHGLMHLIGYDDLTVSQRVKMERRQSTYLKMVKY